MTFEQETLDRFKRFCDSQGVQKEAQASMLKVPYYDYRYYIEGSREIPSSVIEKMVRIVEGRMILDQAILKTRLYKDIEEHVKRALFSKQMITLVGPTGQGKSYSARHICRQQEQGCRYFTVLTDLQKKQSAAVKNFIRDLGRACGISERSTNSLRHLINSLSTDTRTVIVLDESQRLISDDWGYFKVLQDLIDQVPNLSIIMLGNFRFYEQVYVSSERTYSGTLDEEQFLRRISHIHMLPRLHQSDVKLWCEYNNISLKPQEMKELADYFGRRAALSDLDTIQAELVRLMGKSQINSWRDVNLRTLITVYKTIHREIRYNEDQTGDESYEKTTQRDIQSKSA